MYKKTYATSKNRSKVSVTATMRNITGQLRKQGLKLVPEPQSDPSLGPVYTIEALKEGTTNSEVVYKLYYAGLQAKHSSAHRNAVAKAAKKAEQKKPKAAKSKDSESSESRQSSQGSE